MLPHKSMQPKQKEKKSVPSINFCFYSDCFLEYTSRVKITLGDRLLPVGYSPGDRATPASLPKLTLIRRNWPVASLLSLATVLSEKKGGGGLSFYKVTIGNITYIFHYWMSSLNLILTTDAILDTIQGYQLVGTQWNLLGSWITW